MSATREGYNNLQVLAISTARGGIIKAMNTFDPYVVVMSCILKGGDRADHRMTELNELIASAKGSGRVPQRGETRRTRFGFRNPHCLSPFQKTANFRQALR